MKIGTALPSSATADDLLFLRQLGIEHVRVHFEAAELDPEHVARVSERFGAAGLAIASAVFKGYCAKEIALGLPGAEEKIADVVRFVEYMGECGIPVLDYDFFLFAPLPETAPATTRAAVTRQFDAAVADGDGSLFGRLYRADELWENYRRFIRPVAQAAEQAGVRLALHPDDPPVPRLNGVDRILRDVDSMDRAIGLAESEAAGVLLCVGTWAEGGSAMGMDVCEAIRHYAARDQLSGVHFRNVSSPLPCFTETFLDNGYVDMAEVLATLKAVAYNGLLVPDHSPAFVGDENGRTALAYAIGYIRGLLGALQ